jgi:FkbM family methyltransferase
MYCMSVRGAPHRFAQRTRRIVRPISAFENWRDFRSAATVHDDAETILTTRTGLKITVRHNKWDAEIVSEQFFDRSYLRHFRPGVAPVVVDVGGYIGDFGLLCAHEWPRSRVIIYEPTAENYKMLAKNLELNPQLAPRVTLANKGVSHQPTVTANVQVEGNEVHASTGWYANEASEQREFPCDSLPGIFDVHQIDRIDLLKVDCEGGEYDIFADVPANVYGRIGQVVMEWHRVPDWEAKLSKLREALLGGGFRLENRGQLLYAFR